LAGLPDQRRALLRLLARMHLTPDQATRIYHPDQRAAARIELGDDELLRNPYLLYEADRAAADPIVVTSIDRGLVPDRGVEEAFPVPEPSAVQDPLDPRRMGALAVASLEDQADQGNTLSSAGDVVMAVRAMPVSPPCPVSGDILAAIRPELSQELVDAQLADETPALQLRAGSARWARRSPERCDGGVALPATLSRPSGAAFSTPSWEASMPTPRTAISRRRPGLRRRRRSPCSPRQGSPS
jgi:hypothetical protein